MFVMVSLLLGINIITVGQILPSPSKTAVIPISGVINERTEVYNVFRSDVLTLKGYLDVIRKAGEDSDIDAILIRLNMPLLGWAKANELHRAIAELKNTQKPVFVYFQDAELIHYYIASAADQLIISPTGNLMITGIGIDIYFIKELLNKLYIQADLLTIGIFKTAAEPLTRQTLSPEARSMFDSILNNLYDGITSAIATSRNIEKHKLLTLIDESPYTADAALKAGLVNGVCYEEDVKAFLEEETNTTLELVGDYGIEKPPSPDEMTFFDFFKMFATQTGERARTKSGPQIALVYAVGMIIPGAPDDFPFAEDIVSAEAIAQTLEDLAEKEDIKGVVLRVDSGGGSATASDIICNAVGDFASQKPIVASLSDTAASGGYYIAMAAKKILAEPFTITGSIGVVGGKIVLGDLYRKIGINKESLSRGKHHDILSESRAFTEEERATIEELMQDVYDRFIEKAAKYRGIEIEEMNALAEGRVWTGSQAKEQKLIDEIGGIEQAINAVKELAGISTGEKIELVIYPKPPGFIKILQSFFSPGFYGQTRSLQAQILQAFDRNNTTPLLLTFAQLLQHNRLLYLSPILIIFN